MYSNVGKGENNQFHSYGIKSKISAIKSTRGHDDT